MNAEQKRQICDLINKCIGERSLTQVQKQSGLSRAKLHRLRNGQFAKMPEETILRALTDVAANPQNGITYESFSSILQEQTSNSTNKRKSSIDALHSYLIEGVLVDWLKSFGDVTIKKSTDGSKFDLIASVDNKTYYFEYKLIFEPTPGRFNLKSLMIHLIANIATCNICAEDTFVIITNSKKFSSLLKENKLNISSKVMLLLVDLESLEIIQIDELN